MGTKNHDQDLEMVAPALRQIYKRWGDRVTFEIVGAVANTATLERLRDLPLRVIQTPASYADYPLFFAWFSRSINWDIAIAPLRRDAYNVCKSDIKLLDYSSIGAVGVYSDVPPYDSVVDGELGLVAQTGVVESWADALDRLVGDRELRAHIADTSAAYLFAERTLAHRAGDWADAMESLVG
jgi:hypothetical protein